MLRIDINCDMGEFDLNHPDNRDASLISYISSCNIACGAHAGNDAVIESVVDYALANNVKIGAHPSYPDPENFGRKVLEMSAASLKKTLIEQINRVEDIALKKGALLNHVKLHGALYNRAAIEKQTAEVVISALENLNSKPSLYAPEHSVLARLARMKKIDVTYEAFADRAYNNDLSLVDRRRTNAVKHSAEEVSDQVLRIVKHGAVITIANKEIDIKAQTICLHGDHKNSVTIAKYVFGQLKEEGIVLAR